MSTSHKKNSSTGLQPILILLVFSILFILVLLGTSLHFSSSNRNKEYGEEPVLEEEKPLQKEEVSIVSVNYSKPIYYSGEPLVAEVKIYNPYGKVQNLWMGYSLKGPSGEWFDMPAKEISLSPKDTTRIHSSVDKELFPSENAFSGPYLGVFALWDQSPMEEGANRLTDLSIPDAFRFQHGLESFESSIDQDWYSRSGILGRSTLQPKNVTVEKGHLQITHPQNTLQGGELQSREPFHYGSYEIRMRVPDAPSSITGFFLYKAPDFYHEIDIEIFNEKDGDILLTTYYEGSIHHEAVLPLDFDPTANFHQYRIDYYPEKVTFYIDDIPVQQWEDGFSQEPMYLYVNTWFPQWLEGIAPDEDQVLEVDWIRY